MINRARLFFGTEATLCDREVLASARLRASVKVFVGRVRNDGTLEEVKVGLGRV